MVGLTMGCLVTWQDGAEERLGIVVGLTGQRVDVQFDDLDGVRFFNRSARQVLRKELSGQVKRVSTGQVGVIQTLATAEPPRWNVVFDHQVTTIQELDLRPHLLHDPESKLRNGMLGKPPQFWLALTAHAYQLEALNRDLISLSESRVTLMPHQVSVVHRVISNYPHRFLLCDEVGLGKTIEAGVILKELRARKIAGRTLIIVPPNLMRQWQFELKSKFNEVFAILTTETVRHLRNQYGADTNPFEVVDSAIVSSSWIIADQWRKLANEVEWDLVIVDEAHHARVRYYGNKTERTQLYRVVEQLVSPEAFSKRSALFLTATPMQLNAGEIYGLIELLDPALFPTYKHFTDQRDKVPGLNALVQDLKIHGYAGRKNQESILKKVSGWLSRPSEEIEAELLNGPAGIAKVADELADKHLLTQILIRNRKKVVGGFMPRKAHRWEVTLTEEERTALAAVEDYVRNGYQLANAQQNSAIGFVMVIFQKLMASSTWALRTSLDKRRARLEGQSTTAAAAQATLSRLKTLEQEFDEGGEDDDEVSELVAYLGDAQQKEAAELRFLVDLLDGLPHDSKAERLLAGLRGLEQQEENPKVLLFTEFRKTQEYLRSLLETELGWDVQVFHGQLKPTAKDEAVEAFRSADGPSILLSTEAGGEGRNFQFCHLLINYDLPWNPMRVEQRIGRVDRLGQASTVQVFNFWIRGTIEERVLNVLENRIGIFEETVGGLDPILGDTETDLKKIFRLGDAERDAELAKYEASIAERIAEAREAEEKLRDFIMETKSFSKALVQEIEDETEPIPPPANEAFCIALLADVNTWLNQQPDGTFKLAFHEPFISDYPRHTKDIGTKRTVTFHPDIAADSEHVEYMTLGHPVIDDLVARVVEQRYVGSAAAIAIEGDAVLPPTSGWLVAHRLTVPGIKTIRELHTSFVDDDGLVDPDTAKALLDRAATIARDMPLAPDDLDAAVVGSGLESAVNTARSAAWTRLDNMEADAAQDARSRLDRELAKLTQYYDYRDQAAADRLDASERTLEKVRASDDPGERSIIPVWASNVQRNLGLVAKLKRERLERLAELQRQTVGAGEVTLLALARVEIREPKQDPERPSQEGAGEEQVDPA